LKHPSDPTIGATGPMVACVFSCSFALYASLLLALALHEAAHAAMAIAWGGELGGFTLSILFPHGVTHDVYPYLEVSPWARTAVSAAGPLADATLGGSIILALWLSRRLREALLPAFLAVASLGGLAWTLSDFALVGPAVFVDLRVVCSTLGLSVDLTRVACGIVGSLGLVAIGFWFARTMLTWASSYFFCETYRRRVLALAVTALFPLAAVGLACVVAWRFLRNGPAFGRALGAAELSITLALAAVGALGVALRPLPTSGPGTRRLSNWSALRYGLLAVGAACLVLFMGWKWDPARVPDFAAIARRAERSPNDEKTLRWAAYWSQRGHRYAEGLAYLERAVAVAPESPGALFSLGMAYRKDKPAQALALFLHAARLLPDNESVWAGAAKTYEDLLQWNAAASCWRHAADAAQESVLERDSRERHIRMYLERASKMEGMPDGAAPGAAANRQDGTSPFDSGGAGRKPS
jgi:hypothetical protein